MRNLIVLIMVTVIVFLPLNRLLGVETSPRISDKEIVERLTRLEEGQRNIDKRFDDVNKRIDDVNKRIDDLRTEINERLNTLQWMLGLFITIVLAILGFVLRMQWQMQKRLTRVETALETHRDEIAFLKGLIEKLLSPKGAA